MTRCLTGSFRDLPPLTLLRVLSASATSGVLELVTAQDTLRLEVAQGRSAAASDDELALASRVFASTDGHYRFDPCDITPPAGPTLPLTAYADAAQGWSGRRRSPFSSEVDLERLVAGNLIDFSPRATSTSFHVLAAAPPENPLDELLSELETTAPEELLMEHVGVVATDPRLWRGPLEREWRQRGWQVILFAAPTTVPVEDLDLLIVHHQLSVTRVGQESDWTDLIRRAGSGQRTVPVVWIGPLGDPTWVHRLVEAGVSFLLPPPAGESGETLHRFLGGLTLVVNRQLRSRGTQGESQLATSVSELVDALLHEAEPDQAIATLLQLAAGSFLRGALLRVEETAFLCRAGFGYPLSRGLSALPRGVGLLERVVRGREPSVGIDPDAGGALQLARLLGLERLSPSTAVIPLGAGASVAGVLVADREGEDLPDLAELVLLVSRLGGVVLQA